MSYTLHRGTELDLANAVRFSAIAAVGSKQVWGPEWIRQHRIPGRPRAGEQLAGDRLLARSPGQLPANGGIRIGPVAPREPAATLRESHYWKRTGFRSERPPDGAALPVAVALSAAASKASRMTIMLPRSTTL